MSVPARSSSQPFKSLQVLTSLIHPFICPKWIQVIQNQTVINHQPDIKYTIIITPESYLGASALNISLIYLQSWDWIWRLITTALLTIRSRPQDPCQKRVSLLSLDQMVLADWQHPEPGAGQLVSHQRIISSTSDTLILPPDSGSWLRNGNWSHQDLWGGRRAPQQHHYPWESGGHSY